MEGCVQRKVKSIMNMNDSRSKYLKKKRNFQRKSTYQENVLFRKKERERSIRTYVENVFYREKAKQRSSQSYRENVMHREKVNKRCLGRYQENEAFRKEHKARSIRKYCDSILYREQVKKRTRHNYAVNLLHRDVSLCNKFKVKQRSICKYAVNLLHRETVKQRSTLRYRLNEVPRQNVKAMSHRKYGNPEHKKHVIAASTQRKKEMKEKLQQFDFVMKQFSEKVKDGPDFVCCVCQRLLFRHQVLQCKRENYMNRKDVAAVADVCISEVYLHKCNNCVNPCQWLNTARDKLWICFSCNDKVSRGEMPAECAVNKMGLDPIPPELACLNNLEQHLIGLHIPFLKMLALPKGGQNGVHGPVTCSSKYCANQQFAAPF
ncbi:uncharacterized protein LOC118471687 [Amphiprion ocellaris]|uniref:uncharacterized protein LOC118471687 n=1 Tax=Amphiprion ocellaris TaxID=80972 RepID=UPI0024114CA5|nr:uncharacterized protein LOC118471687 [Amphiprion ocellaris]